MPAFSSTTEHQRGHCIPASSAAHEHACGGARLSVRPSSVVTAPITPGAYVFEAIAADGLFTALWDNDNVLQELDSSLIVQAQYTDYPGYWGGLSSERRGGTSSFHGVDQQSSARILVGSTGAVTDSYAYRAFGTEWQSGNGSRNSYRYVGQYGYYLDSTAMQYVRARYMDVQAGRWVSRDPVGFDGGDWNLYRYVRNEVVGRMDASGLTGCTCGCSNNKVCTCIPGIGSCYNDHTCMSCGRCQDPCAATAAALPVGIKAGWKCRDIIKCCRQDNPSKCVTVTIMDIAGESKRLIDFGCCFAQKTGFISSTEGIAKYFAGE